jgi:hypothetical protein
MVVFSELFGALQYAINEKGLFGVCFFDKIMITKDGFEVL